MKMYIISAHNDIPNLLKHGKQILTFSSDNQKIIAAFDAMKHTPFWNVNFVKHVDRQSSDN